MKTLALIILLLFGLSLALYIPIFILSAIYAYTTVPSNFMNPILLYETYFVVFMMFIVASIAYPS
jgi:hypothetical protein